MSYLSGCWACGDVTVEFVGLVGGHDECGGECRRVERYRSRCDDGWLCNDSYKPVAAAVCAADGDIHCQVDRPAGFAHGAGDRVRRRTAHDCGLVSGGAP